MDPADVALPLAPVRSEPLAVLLRRPQGTGVAEEEERGEKGDGTVEAIWGSHVTRV